MAAAFALIGIRMFFIKGAVFSKTCTSDLDDGKGKKMSCSCESNPDYVCENYEKHHGSKA